MTRGTNRLWDAPAPTGYRVGPVLSPLVVEVGKPLLASPFARRWEQDPRVDDGHPHRWETVLLGPPRRVQEVVRCEICQAPRCGSSTDRDPCMLRRHHRREHVLLFGTGRRTGMA